MGDIAARLTNKLKLPGAKYNWSRHIIDIQNAQSKSLERFFGELCKSKLLVYGRILKATYMSREICILKKKRNKNIP